MNAMPESPESAALPTLPAESPLPAASMVSLPEAQSQSSTDARVAAIVDLMEALMPLLVRAVTAVPGGKPGWKTTEFWLVAFMSALNIWGACAHMVSPTTAALVTGVLTGLYAILRSAVKTSVAQTAATFASTLNNTGDALVSTENLIARSAGLPPVVLISSKPNGAQGEPATGNAQDAPHETKATGGIAQ